ncbi:hypothetical protein OIU84_006897 [Salix udensis]|uniref:Uncharacterized protein n=1 Tax=Salix udensis TaxID=889485 RepID=A0AAD6P2L2_9ROSI|nr:hypothetical protein OIU84_006897 [Salix udensis]
MFLSLSNSISKAINSDVPNFLYSQYDLRSLNLSSSNFGGMFPSWLLENNTRLAILHLRQNSFVGPLKLPHHPILKMGFLDISNNNISGQVPRNICSVFPYLLRFVMAMNGLTGSIPSCFGNMSFPPIVLDLSHNLFSIAKPEQLQGSEYVKLSNNNLGGEISPSIFNSSFLRYLYLDGNKFTGHENLDKAIGAGSETTAYAYLWHMSYENGLLARKINDVGGDLEEINTEETVKFTTKRRPSCMLENSDQEVNNDLEYNLSSINLVDVIFK